MWVHIATSVYSACVKKGGTAKTCEASAIVQANGAVGEPANPPKGNARLLTHAETTARPLTIHASFTTPATRETLHGREFLVAPAVLIVEGVLNEAYIPGHALVAQPWNGCPVVLDHHKNEAGTPISARSPEVFERCGIGWVYNASLGLAQRKDTPAQTLKAELWLDMDRIEALGGDALAAMERIENEEAVEISTGFWSKALVTNGVFADTPYVEMLYDLQPDHLALLPNEIGACSLVDGCGTPRLHHADCGCGDTPCTCEEMPMDDTSQPQGWRGFLQMLKDFVTREAPEDEDLRVHVMSTARTPTFKGTESTAWSAPTLGDYCKSCFGDMANPPSSMSDLSGSQKRTIAGHTLLGDPSAATFSDLSFFPVVNPSTSHLNENALRAVISGRGSQAKISAQAKSSAQGVARRLLNRHFDAQLATAAADETLTVEQTDSDLRDSLQGCLAREMDQDYVPIYIETVDPTTQSFTYHDGQRLSRRYYTITNGLVALLPNVEEVQRDTRYITVPGTQEPESEEMTEEAGEEASEDTQEEEPATMERHVPGVTVKMRVNALIGNAQSGWTEKDRIMLERMDEATLIRLEQQPQSRPVETRPEPTTLEQALEYIPNQFGVRETLASAVQRYERHKHKLIEILVNVKQCPFAREELETMQDTRLEQLVVMAGEELPDQQSPRVSADYRGRHMPQIQVIPDERDGVPEPPKTMDLVILRQKELGLR